MVVSKIRLWIPKQVSPIEMDTSSKRPFIGDGGPMHPSSKVSPSSFEFLTI